MSKATIVAKEPVILRLEAGTYYWCACGKSKNQPFCDGSHEGSGVTPTEFEVTEARNVALGQCKQTKNPPFCDGTHVEL